jgi:hypothetical protein
VDAIELNHRDARRKLASSAKARDGREDLDERL